MLEGSKHEWPLRRLSDVTGVFSGATPKTSVAEYWNGDVVWLTPKDLGALEGIEVSESNRRITQQGFESCSAHVIPSNSVVMSSRAPIGHLAINTIPVCTNQGCKSFVPKSELNTRYLYWALRGAMPEIQHLGDGCTFDEVSKSDLEAFEIPVPPLGEQRRLVTRIEALTSRAQELRDLNASVAEDMTGLLAVEYRRICFDAPVHRFGNVAKLVRRRVETRLEASYSETGIRSFGKGTFHKPALTGRQLGNKRVFRISPGDLVFMNVFAWEGAIAVAKPEDEGRVGSHRFMTHEVDSVQATAEFLCYHLLTAQGLEHIRAASPGSAGRNRTLGIKKLHAIPVPLPAIEEQRRFSKLHALRDNLRRLQTETDAELAAFTAALLAKAFLGEL